MFSKWWHDRKRGCGYAPADAGAKHAGQIKQGQFWCRHCQAWRLSKPILTNDYLQSLIE